MFSLKREFSIKYKLLLLLVAMPILCLGIYVLLARDMFKEDKKSYVLDAASTLARTVAGNVRSEIQLLVAGIRPIVGGYDPKSAAFDTVAHQLFEGNEAMQIIKIWSPQNSGLEEKTGLQKSDFKAVDKTREKRLAEQALKNKFAIELENDGVWVAHVFSSGTQPNNLVAVGFLQNGGNFASELKKVESYTVSLVDDSGQVLMTSAGHGPSEQLPLTRSASRLWAQGSVRDGATELKAPTGEELLVAFSAVGTGNYYVVSSLAKKTAFQAVEILTFKSLLFFAIVICLSFVVSILASNTLTSDLRSLFTATQEVARGKFDVEIEIESQDEVGHLAQGFKFMATEVSRLMSELEAYSKTLEEKVEQRTAELKESYRLQKAMVNSLSQGFLIFDRHGICLPVYSVACERLFEQNPKGLFIGDLFRTSQKEVPYLRQWIDFTFEGRLQFEEMMGLAVKNLTTPTGRYLELEYHPINSEDGTLEGIVLVATDKTQQKEAEELAEKQKAYAEMIEKMLRNKTQLRKFFAEIKTMIDWFQRDLNAESHSLSFDDLYRHVHTIKGNALAFRITELAELCHNLEGRISAVTDREHPANKDLQDIGIMFTDLKNSFTDFVTRYRDFFGAGFLEGNHQVVEVAWENVESFIEFLSQQPGRELLQETFAEKIVAQPLHEHLAFLNELLEDTATRQDKKVQPLSFSKGQDIRLVGDSYGELFSSLVHAIRNSVTHGLETPDERRTLGKSEAGKVDIAAREFTFENQRWIELKITDDGRGVDPHATRERMMAKGFAEAANMNDEDVIQLILTSGVSSAAQTTMDAGRGVGMQAVTDATHRLGGRIRVQSELGKGMQLIIQVPVLSFISNLKKSEVAA